MNSQHPHGGSGGAPYDRDREMEERHRAIQQHEEMARREQERERERERDRDRDRELESNERFQSTPHHSSSAGSIPIHQPVASRTANAIHSPGGILGNYNGNAPSVPLGGGGGNGGAPPGSVASFGGPLQQSEQHGRQGQHGGQGNAGSQHQMFAPMPHSQGPAGGSQSATGPSAAAAAVFGGALQQQQQQSQQQDGRGGQQGGPPFRGVTPGGHQIPGGITQGQQPILNVSGLYVIFYHLAVASDFQPPALACVPTWFSTCSESLFALTCISRAQHTLFPLQTHFALPCSGSPKPYLPPPGDRCSCRRVSCSIPSISRPLQTLGDERLLHCGHSCHCVWGAAIARRHTRLGCYRPRGYLRVRRRAFALPVWRRCQPLVPLSQLPRTCHLLF